MNTFESTASIPVHSAIDARGAEPGDASSLRSREEARIERLREGASIAALARKSRASTDEAWKADFRAFARDARRNLPSSDLRALGLVWSTGRPAEPRGRKQR